MNNADRPNTGEIIGAVTGVVADVTDAANQEQIVNTGKMSAWLRFSSVLASAGGTIARLLKRR